MYKEKPAPGTSDHVTAFPSSSIQTRSLAKGTVIRRWARTPAATPTARTKTTVGRPMAPTSIAATEPVKTASDSTTAVASPDGPASSATSRFVSYRIIRIVPYSLSYRSLLYRTVSFFSAASSVFLGKL